MAGHMMESLARLGLQLPPFLAQGNASSSLGAGNGSGFGGAGSGPTPGGDGGMPGAAAGAGAGGAFPAGVMDSFLATAGYSSSPLMQLFLFVYRQLGAQLGLDPSVVLTMLGFLWGASKLFSQVWGYVWDLLDRHFMCAMYVGEYDHIYSQLMKWLSLQQSIKSSRYLMAQTVWKSAWDEEEELENSLFWTDGDDGDGECKYLNFSNQAARSGPRYVPAMGITGFWHKGTYFRVTRRKESLMSTSGWGAMKDLEEIKISCFGRSIEPIKRLLADAKTTYYFDTYRKTTIYRPRPKELRRENGMWHQVARRPIRPMRTVVLDGQEKHNVLADVNEYLHPATPRWYASRGIPLRRGYLFHGPPGTGKTSFSFALAGVFGIDIYVISLQDVNVTEEDLAALFTKLPRRCIVLLEDIDTAGLRRDDDDDEDSESEEKADDKAKEVEGEKATETKALTNGVNGDHAVKSGKKNGKKEKTKKKAKKKVVDSDSDSHRSDSEDKSDSSDSDSDSDKKSKKKRKGKNKKRGASRTATTSSSKRKVVTLESISLSGLLNAIDGVASHEGRVLIMTTNKPESLDEALIRPGRVDVQVAFMNASSDQAAELFYRMYEASRPRQAHHYQQQQQKQKHEQAALAAAPTTSTQESLRSSSSADGSAVTSAVLLQTREELDVSEEELRGIAKEFGRRIPPATFSPAEIQGFLLKRKKSPRKALEDVEGWVEAAVKQKEANSKVSTVQ
ncbi:mitochondrial chaperone bcs1 [Purpureocillium lavendulum]|uniref:Mitochondrial chaperone bcs1 n=1 Tax=Purpureocillium lavendulum TaxID=1247861 RepID=A0AB34FKJ8_9HYPO|nr:mitochondrial chaperone bcs1 [Purpureocillium lavendulum]